MRRRWLGDCQCLPEQPETHGNTVTLHLDGGASVLRFERRFAHSQVRAANGYVPAGRVRWEIIHDPLLGTRVELTQTLPARLADLRATGCVSCRRRLRHQLP